MKKLKYVLFIPVTLAAIVLINLAFVNLLNWTVDKTLQWYFDLNTIFFVLLVPFFWGTIWGIFKLAALAMAALLIPVSPDKKFSIYTLGVFSLINCLVLILHYWLRDINYSWSAILMSLIISMFIVDFSASIVLVFSKKGINAIEE